MTGHRARRGAARSAAVLALLLGLLAMHGTALGHHTTSSGRGTGMVGAPAPLGNHGVAQHLLPTAPRVEQEAVRSGCTGCSDHGPVVLCLAVLTAAAGLARLLARRSCARVVVPAGHHALRRPRDPPLLAPPDLVAELCVSRT